MRQCERIATSEAEIRTGRIFIGAYLVCRLTLWVSFLRLLADPKLQTAQNGGTFVTS